VDGLEVRRLNRYSLTETAPPGVRLRYSERIPGGRSGILRRKIRQHIAWFLMTPGVVFLCVVFVVPLLIMVHRSVTDPSPTNYTKFFSSGIYLRALWFTIMMAFLVTIFALLISYPYAYVLTMTSNSTFRVILLFVVLMPFWSSLLVRTYAWTVLLRDTGIINTLLLKFHIIEQPIAFVGTSRGVVIGMTHILMPYMVLALYANMRKIPPNLVPAARSLGANRRRAFMKVFLPLSVPGIALGSLLVFVLGIGFYITPAILGGRTVFFSLLIDSQIESLLNFGFGSALAIILLVVIVLIAGVGSRLLKNQDVTF
jgi:putative spermidine/putrescine transport system permease protein